MASNPKIVYVLGAPMELISENVVRPLRRGRPASSGVYGEPTKTVRVPISLLPDLMVKIEALKAHVASQRPSSYNPFFITPGLDISKLLILPLPTSTLSSANHPSNLSDPD